VLDRICIRPPLDVGRLAELLLFYGHVTLMLNRSDLYSLVRGCGVSATFDLLNSGHVAIRYMQNGFAIRTDSTANGRVLHTPTTFRIEGTALEQAAVEVFRAVTGRDGAGRRQGEAFAGLVEPLSYEGELRDGVDHDFEDATYVGGAVACTLSILAPKYELPEPMIFEPVPVQGYAEATWFEVATNLDFDKINAIYHEVVPPEHSSVTAAFLLSHILNARGDLYFGTLTNADLAVSDAASAIMQLKCQSIAEQSRRRQEGISLFNDMVLGDGRSIRESINSGQHTFSEFMDVLAKAGRFRKWIANQAPDDELLRSYISEISHVSWVDKLPPKTVRWVLFAAAGFAIGLPLGPELGAAASAGLGAVDSLLLDRLILGWKPNQFVESTLARFIDA
jgi:hypothetical protein